MRCDPRELLAIQKREPTAAWSVTSCILLARTPFAVASFSITPHIVLELSCNNCTGVGQQQLCFPPQSDK